MKLMSEVYAHVRELDEFTVSQRNLLLSESSSCNSTNLNSPSTKKQQPSVKDDCPLRTNDDPTTCTDRVQLCEEEAHATTISSEVNSKTDSINEVEEGKTRDDDPSTITAKKDIVILSSNVNVKNCLNLTEEEVPFENVKDVLFDASLSTCSATTADNSMQCSIEQKVTIIPEEDVDGGEKGDTAVNEEELMRSVCDETATQLLQEAQEEVRRHDTAVIAKEAKMDEAHQFLKNKAHTQRQGEDLVFLQGKAQEALSLPVDK